MTKEKFPHLHFVVAGPGSAIFVGHVGLWRRQRGRRQRRLRQLRRQQRDLLRPVQLHQRREQPQRRERHRAPRDLLDHRRSRLGLEICRAAFLWIVKF